MRSERRSGVRLASYEDANNAPSTLHSITKITKAAGQVSVVVELSEWVVRGGVQDGIRRTRQFNDSKQQQDYSCKTEIARTP